jgi:hypothetical protein
MCGSILLALGIGHGRGGGADYTAAGFACRYIGLPTPMLCAAYVATVAYGATIVPALVRTACALWMCAAIPLIEIPNGLLYGGVRAASEGSLREAIRSYRSPTEVFAAFGSRVYPDEGAFCWLFRMLADNSIDPFDRADPLVVELWRGAPITLAAPTIEPPRGKQPFYGLVDEDRLGLAVAPGTVLRYATKSARRVNGTFGVLSRRYIYGPVGRLRVVITFRAPNEYVRTLLDRTLDPMDVPSDRTAHDFDLALPPQNGTLCLRMLRADRSLAPGSGFWSRVAIE